VGGFSLCLLPGFRDRRYSPPFSCCPFIFVKRVLCNRNPPSTILAKKTLRGLFPNQGIFFKPFHPILPPPLRPPPRPPNLETQPSGGLDGSWKANRFFFFPVCAQFWLWDRPFFLPSRISQSPSFDSGRGFRRKKVVHTTLASGPRQNPLSGSDGSKLFFWSHPLQFQTPRPLTWGGPSLLTFWNSPFPKQTLFSLSVFYLGNNAPFQTSRGISFPRYRCPGFGLPPWSDLPQVTFATGIL